MSYRSYLRYGLAATAAIVLVIALWRMASSDPTHSDSMRSDGQPSDPRVSAKLHNSKSASLHKPTPRQSAKTTSLPPEITQEIVQTTDKPNRTNVARTRRQRAEPSESQGPLQPKPTRGVKPDEVRPPPLPNGRPGAQKHQLKDRIGGAESLVAQLNQELMPLAAECIEMAQTRNPDLEGLLSLSINLIPIDEHKAIVESVESQDDNTVKDPELLECLEQSSLAIENLQTRKSFSISIPVAPEDAP